MILSSLIYMKTYLVLSETYPSLPSMDIFDRDTMNQYLDSWGCEKKEGMLTCEGYISFYVTPQICLFFCIKFSCIIMKHVILSMLYTPSDSGVVSTPTKLHLQLIWIGRFLLLAVNKTTLQWPIMNGGDGANQSLGFYKGQV